MLDAMTMLSSSQRVTKLPVDRDREGNYASACSLPHKNHEPDQGLTLSPKILSDDVWQDDQLATFGAFTDADLDAFLGPVQVNLLGESLQLNDQCSPTQSLQEPCQYMQPLDMDWEPTINHENKLSSSKEQQPLLSRAPRILDVLLTPKSDKTVVSRHRPGELNAVKEQVLFQGRCNQFGEHTANPCGMSASSVHKYELNNSQETYEDNDCHIPFSDSRSTDCYTHTNEHWSEHQELALVEKVERRSHLHSSGPEDLLPTENSDREIVSPTERSGGRLLDRNNSHIEPINHNSSFKPSESPTVNPQLILLFALIELFEGLCSAEPTLSKLNENMTLDKETTKYPEIPKPDRNLCLGFDKLFATYEKDLVFQESVLHWTLQKMEQRHGTNSDGSMAHHPRNVTKLLQNLTAIRQSVKLNSQVKYQELIQVLQLVIAEKDRPIIPWGQSSDTKSQAIDKLVEDKNHLSTTNYHQTSTIKELRLRIEQLSSHGNVEPACLIDNGKHIHEELVSCNSEMITEKEIKLALDNRQLKSTNEKVTNENQRLVKENQELEARLKELVIAKAEAVKRAGDFQRLWEKEKARKDQDSATSAPAAPTSSLQNSGENTIFMCAKEFLDKSHFDRSYCGAINHRQNRSCWKCQSHFDDPQAPQREIVFLDGMGFMPPKRKRGPAASRKNTPSVRGLSGSVQTEYELRINSNQTQALSPQPMKPIEFDDSRRGL